MPGFAKHGSETDIAGTVGTGSRAEIGQHPLGWSQVLANSTGLALPYVTVRSRAALAG